MSASIDPSASIHPSAVIGANCRVGPSCIVGPEVRIGEGNILLSHVVLDGKLTAGGGNRFYPFCHIGGDPQLAEGRPSGDLVIGDNNVFREGATAQVASSAGAGTMIGDNCRFLANSHVGHDCRIGNRVIVNNSTAIAGHALIEDDVYLSGLVGVHQWISIGRYSFVAAGSMVNRSILPYCLAEGNRAKIRGHNAVGIGRVGIGPKKQSEIKKIVRDYFYGRIDARKLSSLTESGGGVMGEWVRFAQAAKRGLALPSRGQPNRNRFPR